MTLWYVLGWVGCILVGGDDISNSGINGSIMVIGKKASVFYLFLAIFLFCVFAFTLLITHPKTGIFLPVVFGLLICFSGKSVWIGGRKIVVDKVQKQIEITNFFFGRGRIFRFDDFDGYATGRIKRGRSGGLHKLGWLVLRGRLAYRIDEMFFRNMSELEVELKDLKYVGYQTINFKKRLLMMFCEVKAEKG